MPDAEREDEAFERNVAPRRNRAKQIAHRGFAIALDLFQRELLSVALLQREAVGGLLHPALFEEIVDLLGAETVDVEGAARDEQLQMLDGLRLADEAASATADGIEPPRVG